MKKTDTVAHCLNRIATIEDRVRALTKALADHNVRLTKLERQRQP